MDSTTPTSMAFRERGRTRVACLRLAGGLLAGLCLLAPPAASRLVAGEEKPPASANENSSTEGPEEKSREQKKPAQETRPGTKPAGRPKPTPAPSTGQGTGPSAAPPGQGGVVPKPAPPAPTPEPDLSFTDFDLERFHRPVRKDEEAAEGEEQDGASDAAGTIAGGAEAQPPSVKAKPVAEKPGPKPAKPKPAAERPGAQPVKPKPAPERLGPEAAKPSGYGGGPEKSRQSQIQAARQRIASLQARLGELYSRRDALANPATARAAQADGLNAQVKAGQPPPPIDANSASARTPGVKDLLRQVDAEIGGAEEEIEAARNELASVEIRFAQEARNP